MPSSPTDICNMALARIAAARISIRPCAAPNPLILELGLLRFLASSVAKELAIRLLNEPHLFGNRHHGASPS
ncbi:MAG: hypothetical protein KF712_16240 [Akkermansiaceae bacterium]|nr:hypothetical protein [Akkermansiaceae bacterium]